MVQVVFVSDDQDLASFSGHVLNVLNPIFNSFKRPPVGYVIDHNGALGLLVVGLSHSGELLLAGSVPELDLNALVFDLHYFGNEIHAQSALIFRAKFIMDKSLKNVGLAHPWVSNKDYLEHIIKHIRVFHYNLFIFFNNF